jgi:hypothetical protein
MDSTFFVIEAIYFCYFITKQNIYLIIYSEFVDEFAKNVQKQLVLANRNLVPLDQNSLKVVSN